MSAQNWLGRLIERNRRFWQQSLQQTECRGLANLRVGWTLTLHRLRVDPSECKPGVPRYLLPHRLFAVVRTFSADPLARWCRAWHREALQLDVFSSRVFGRWASRSMLASFSASSIFASRFGCSIIGIIEVDAALCAGRIVEIAADRSSVYCIARSQDDRATRQVHHLGPFVPCR